MTPKEKAENIFNKMFDYQVTSVLGGNHTQYGYAKQCALIAVDELILYAHNNYYHNYWQEVKQEIEKL
jgi:hypothetical protein